MSGETVLLILSVMAGAYMAWNIGANDCANAMASAVGAKVITLRQALVLATILTFLGATFVGSHVAQTIRKGVIDSQAIGDPRLIWMGLLSALLAAALWVCLATYKNCRFHHPFHRRGNHRCRSRCWGPQRRALGGGGVHRNIVDNLSIV